MRYNLMLILLFATNRVSSKRFPGDSANPLAIGGNYIHQGECPWMCPMFYEVSQDDSIYFCGSSLVTNQYVITAAHCVQEKRTSHPIDSSKIFTYSGIYDLTNPNDGNTNIHRVQQFKIHPRWDVSSQRFDADIALIKLSNSVEFSQFVQRIALPTGEFRTDDMHGLVAGYGKSESDDKHENKPKKIKIPVVDTETCYQNHEVFSQLKSRDAFCAGKPGVIPCNGDSGSSFYYLQNSSPILVGIVSSGIRELSGKCKKDTFVLFTDVYKFVDWIKKEVGSGYLEEGQKKVPATNIPWKQNDAICEYIVDDGYRCSLRGVRSTTSNTKLTGIYGQHNDNRDDNDVNKVWIVEQEAKYIPEMSGVAEKFPRVSDFRIWSCGLKFIERSKLSVFAKRLRVLDFFNNAIEEVPADSFNDLVHLEELKLLNNRIKHLPETLLHNLRNLKWFFAEFNEIEDLQMKFFENTQIVVVSMKNNRLRKIFVDFRHLRNVNIIDFSNNNCISQCLGHYCGQMSVGEMQREIEEKCR